MAVSPAAMPVLNWLSARRYYAEAACAIRLHNPDELGDESARARDAKRQAGEGAVGGSAV